MNYIDPRFLKAAFEWKYKHRDATHFKLAGLELPYENMEGKIGIFQRARENLPSIYRNESDFPNTEEGNMKLVDTVVEKLYRHQDQTLEKYFAPPTTAAEDGLVMVEEPTAVPPEQVATGEPASTLTGGAYLPSLPRTPVIHTIPQTKPPLTKAPVKETVPGLKTTPETGLDYEGKPYPKISPAITGAGKNLTSQAGRFMHRASSRLATGLSRLLGGMAGAAGRGLVGLGLRASYGLVDISNQMTRGSLIKLPSGRVGLLLLGSFLLLVFATGFIGALPSEQPSPQVPQPSPTTYTPGAGSGLISCPLNNGVITAGSKDAGGHCSSGYQTDYPCVEPDVTGRATAIDLQAADRMVFLPNIGGNVVTWLVEKIDTDTSYLQQGILVSGGYSVIARAESGGKTYRIRFVHIESPNLQQGQLTSSGSPVGLYRSQENHVHITIQEDDVFKPADLYFNLCK